LGLRARQAGPARVPAHLFRAHWTKQGAAQQATGLQQAAWAAGYKHTYWVEKLMGDDKPGDYYLVAPPVII
jgi:hypothetical protein